MKDYYFWKKYPLFEKFADQMKRKMLKEDVMMESKI